MFDISIENLKLNLKGSTPVHFSYMKSDGSCRSALGTLNPRLIPETLKPRDASKNMGENLKYYDLEKRAWRSLQTDASAVWIME